MIDLRCSVCNQPAVISALADPFGKSGVMNHFCAEHAPQSFGWGGVEKLALQRNQALASLAAIIDFMETRCVGVNQSADAARWELIKRARSNPDPAKAVVTKQVMRFRAGVYQGRPTMEVDLDGNYVQWTDYERLQKREATARAILEPLAEHDPAIREWLK